MKKNIWHIIERDENKNWVKDFDLKLYSFQTQSRAEDEKLLNTNSTEDWKTQQKSPCEILIQIANAKERIRQAKYIHQKNKKKMVTGGDNHRSPNTDIVLWSF